MAENCEASMVHCWRIRIQEHEDGALLEDKYPGKYGHHGVLPACSVVIHHTQFKHGIRGAARWTRRARNVDMRDNHGADGF
ncbi:hypothetical protein V6N13_064504 [Hibiscus sabdariffa]